MDKRKLVLCTLIIVIILLNLFASFRWQYTYSEGDMTYKIDRWTNKGWVDYYPPLALTNGMEYPLMFAAKFDTSEQLEANIHKYAISGYLVDQWLERMRLTYLYYGINAFLVVLTMVVLAMIIRRKKNLESGSLRTL